MYDGLLTTNITHRVKNFSRSPHVHDLITLLFSFAPPSPSASWCFLPVGFRYVEAVGDRAVLSEYLFSLSFYDGEQGAFFP